MARIAEEVTKHYYEVLGLKKDADSDEIRSAYKKRAIKFHPGDFCQDLLVSFTLLSFSILHDPHFQFSSFLANYSSDRNFGNEVQATHQFQKVQEAYDVLGDPKEKQAYDIVSRH
jgi:DnaJ-class molecular chaperone